MNTPNHTEPALAALGPGTDPPTESFEELIALGEAAALAANTRKTYDSGWRSWSRWASEHGHPVLPANPEHILVWLASLADEGKTMATLNTYLASVTNRHVQFSGPNPAHDTRVRSFLAGLNRLQVANGSTPRQAAPLRWEHIQCIVASARTPRRNQPGGRFEMPGQAQRRGSIDIAMITLAHDAALRCNELLALTWGDVEASPSGDHVVRIRRSKTDQTGKGAFAPISEFTAQAVNAIRPPNADSRDRIFDLSPSTINRRMKAAAEAAGLDPTNISSHSPRIGMAQDLVASGVSIAGLMQAGRWKSASSAVRYTEHLAAHDTPVGQYLKTQRYRNSADDRDTTDEPGSIPTGARQAGAA